MQNQLVARGMILREIDVERRDQDSLWGGPDHDDTHTRAEWVALLTRHAGLAVDDGTADSPERFRRQMIRVVALAVAAVESHDRRSGKVAGAVVTGSDF